MKEKKNEAIDRVEEAADESWKNVALRAVKWRAKKGVNFTTDHVWAALEDAGVSPPKEPRAMGAIMRKAVREGLIVSTPKTEISTKESNHKRPVRVWSPLTEVAARVCDCCGRVLPTDLEFHQFHSIQESSVLCPECYSAWVEYKDFLLEKVKQQRDSLNSTSKNIQVAAYVGEDE